jgi:hypothetical protein
MTVAVAVAVAMTVAVAVAVAMTVAVAVAVAMTVAVTVHVKSLLEVRLLHGMQGVCRRKQTDRRGFHVKCSLEVPLLAYLYPQAPPNLA